MNSRISIIIPNRNGLRTIGACLEAIFAQPDEHREVVVVDDCSHDGSPDLIKTFPCTFVRLERHVGASAARNTGAKRAEGNILFFIDADCIVEPGALGRIRRRFDKEPKGTVLGGTYAPASHDDGFFSRVQAAFINYSETKNADHPDYIASHALAMRTADFKRTGGFREDFLPILEDVEFSHRLRRGGYRLVMDPGLRVRHIFNFTLLKSLRNAARKTHYWVIYSLANRDLFSDSGTASSEIKFNGAAWIATAMLAVGCLVTGERWPLATLPLLWGAALYVQRHLFKAFVGAGGRLFAVAAALYFSAVYPAAVWSGAASGGLRYLVRSGRFLGKVVRA